MNIIEKRLDEIRPYENNPRHNDAAVEYVANSLREFGWKQPIVIDRDGIIVAGHTRYKAAQRLGLKTAPCLIADDLTPDQVKAYRLADNKTGEAAEWDFAELERELEGIDMDMLQFGFEDLEEKDGEEKVKTDPTAVLPESRVYILRSPHLGQTRSASSRPSYRKRKRSTL